VKSTLHNIIISRTDSIGDVVLTLPVAAVLKKHFPGITIGFMGKAYTKAVIDACRYVDAFIDVNDFIHQPVSINGQRPDAILHLFPDPVIAKRAKDVQIPLRIGTAHRLYHWFTCNKLVFFSRRRSSLHEAQLNLKILHPLGINDSLSLEALGNLYGLDKLQPLPATTAALLQPHKYNIILHPKSRGSAREWGLDNFIALIRLLDPNRYAIFISGTAEDRTSLQPLFDAVGKRVTDITGLMNLDVFIAFIAQCQGLVANSTGPLHIAAALGKDAYGIYPPMRPIHPGRWAPLGPKTTVFVRDKVCSDCRQPGVPCKCILEITAVQLKEAIGQAMKKV
jgi:ADP-heptose:LPS heptosyltransferase